MASLKPVASPLSVRWREFSQRMLPGLVFLGVATSVAFLWNKSSGRAVIVGQAESVHSTLTTLRPGTLTALNVDTLSRVKKGDILAQILPADLAAINARLTANIDLLRAQLFQSADRNTLSYQQFRLEWMRNNVELTTAKIELQLAESNLDRAGSLFATSIVSEAEVQTRQTRRDTLKDRVNALTRITTDLEQEIARLQPAAPAGETPMDRAISAALAAQAEELKAITDASTLHAPIDGIVSVINRRAGENVAAGEALVVLGSLKPTRIIAYRRQPVDTQIKAGDFVEVSSRSRSSVSHKARVLSVGTQLEPIDPGLLPPLASNLHFVEKGLPLLIEIPEALSLAPAELINIHWNPQP